MVYFFFLIILVFTDCDAFSIPREKASSPQESFEIPEITAPKIDTMVDVGGRRLHCCVYGKGIPAVVLNSGFGAPQTYWNSVIPDIAERTTVVTFDRAGIGKSPSDWMLSMLEGKPYPIKALITGNNPLAQWPNQNRARRAGVTSADIAASLGAFISGQEITDFREGDAVIPIVLRGVEGERCDETRRERTRGHGPGSGCRRRL